MPTDFQLSPLAPADHSELAELLCISLNHWHQTHGRGPIFPSPEACNYFAQIYEALDPGCCITARHARTQRLAGACFYHPRPTHVSLGIMAVHPNYAGQGVARDLLKFITDLADRRNLPTRLISSAINLDSFSLYNRAGFVPRCIYQDMVLHTTATGLPPLSAGDLEIRPATAADIPAIVALESELVGIQRPQDYHFFLNPQSPGQWHLALAFKAGRLHGFLAALLSARNVTVGPGLCHDADSAGPLLHFVLNHFPDRRALILAPCDQPALTRLLYSWGARNVEIHVAQVRGRGQPFGGITFPTFMPESA